MNLDQELESSLRQVGLILYWRTSWIDTPRTALRGQQTEETASGLTPLKLDLTLGLIDGDFEVAHEGHSQQAYGQVPLGINRNRHILRLDRPHADRLQGSDGRLD